MRRKPVGPLATFLALMLPSLAAVWLLWVFSLCACS